MSDAINMSLHAACGWSEVASVQKSSHELPGVLTTQTTDGNQHERAQVKAREPHRPGKACSTLKVRSAFTECGTAAVWRV